jgi:hypothetical protein
MLKYLAAVALIFGLSLYVSIQYKHHTENTTSQPQQPITKALLAGANEQSKPNVSQPKWNAPRWYRLFSWPNGIQVWALFLTLIVIADQTAQTRKAAEAGEDAARAALLSAHASVNAQRAQLLFTVKKVRASGLGGQANFEIWVKNFGKTPARLVGWQAPTEAFVVDPKILPVPPVYEGNYALENYLIPEGEILIAIFSPTQTGHWTKRMEVSNAQNVALDEVQAVIYGQVEYTDGISHDRQSSRYCFRFERRPFSNIGGSIESCGPPEYNLCT